MDEIARLKAEHAKLREEYIAAIARFAQFVEEMQDDFAVQRAMVLYDARCGREAEAAAQRRDANRFAEHMKKADAHLHALNQRVELLTARLAAVEEVLRTADVAAFNACAGIAAGYETDHEKREVAMACAEAADVAVRAALAPAVVLTKKDDA